MKKLIFDFDGTLVDSMEQWANKMFYALKKRNLPYPDDLIKTITPLGDIGAAKYFIDELGAKGSVEDLIADMDEYAIEEYAYKIQAKETVKETLLRLKAKGYSLSVLTASPHRMLDVCLKRLEMFDLFDNVWSCEDFQMTKSNIQIYHQVADRLHTTVEECVFFDDNIHALTVAKKAGMEVVGVYDKSAEEYREEIKELTSLYIYNFSEYVIEKEINNEKKINYLQ